MTSPFGVFAAMTSMFTSPFVTAVCPDDLYLTRCEVGPRARAILRRLGGPHARHALHGAVGHLLSLTDDRELVECRCGAELVFSGAELQAAGLR